jgi:hypothetical protein
MKQSILAAWIFLLALFAVLSFAAPQETRGIGIFPGDPDEDFAPTLIPDDPSYRNLALHRPAWSKVSIVPTDANSKTRRL